MAYKLLDQNGNKMIINGMNKGYIKVPYNYQGLELYNVNAISTQQKAFTSYRRIFVGRSSYYPTGNNKKYVDSGYTATSIKLNGRYSSSSYSDYDVYVDGTLVKSGSYTSSYTDIYTLTKEANTSIVVSGEWDTTNNKFIYNITTNANILREDSYEWDNNTYTDTIELTVGELQDIYETQSSTQLNLPSIDSIRNKIYSKTGRIPTITKVEVYGGAPLYWQPGSDYSRRPWLASNSSGNSPESPSIIGSTSSSTSLKVFGSGYVDVTTLINQTNTTPFYGWMQVGTDTTWYRMNGGDKGALCDSSGNAPIYKVRVTYEY